ncbi:hypothetical protein JCM15415_19110 [Methanobacterium movens]
MTDLEKVIFAWIIALIGFSTFLFLNFFENQLPLMLFYILLFIFCTGVLIVSLKNYSHKVFQIVSWIILVLQGIILVYIYSFRSIYLTTQSDVVYFIGAIIFFIIMVTIPVNNIKRNLKEKK